MPSGVSRNFYSLVVGVANPELLYAFADIGFGPDLETVARSIDGAHSFDIREELTAPNPPGAGYIGMPVTSNPSEEIVFIASATSESGRVMDRSTDGGDTFSPWSSQQHRPVFSRTNALSMWDFGGGSLRRIWRSADQGLTYNFVDIGTGGGTPTAISDAILHRDSLMVAVARRALVLGVDTDAAVWSSPDKIIWTGRDGNLDTALYYNRQAQVRPIPKVDFYTIAKQQVVLQG